MTMQEPTLVNIADILPVPVCCTIPNRCISERLADVAKNNPDDLPTVTLGKADGKMYALNNLDVIHACKNIGLHESIPAQIKQYPSLEDMVIAHVNQSLNEQLFNPLSLFDVVDLLQEKGIDKEKLLDKLWINGTPYEKILRQSDSRLSQKSIEQMQNIVHELSKRRLTPSSIQIPVYAISKIGRIEVEAHQLELIHKIDIMLSNIPDGKFAWPTPEQLDTLYSFIRDSYQDDEISDNILPDNTEIRPENVEKTSKENLETDYVLPQDVLDHLGSMQIRHKNFDSIPNLRKFLDVIGKRDRVKLTLLWSYA